MTQVNASITVVRNDGTPETTPLILDGDELTLTAIAINGTPLEYTFGTKHAGRPAPTLAERERLKAIIAEKQALLAKLEPSAGEGTFSPLARHWLRAPTLALAYQRLANEELRLTGAVAMLSRAQRHWRLLHRLLAWGVVGGLVAHVLVVTFFADYVADGADVYW